MQKEKNRILLVEDNFPDAKLMEIYLQEAYDDNFELITVIRLSEAIDKVKAEMFDVVILDLTLPDSSGIDTFVKLFSKIPDIPIIVLTGLSDDVFGLDAVKFGAEDFLSKNTINAHIIKRAIDYGIERRKLKKKIIDNTNQLNENEKKLKEAQELAHLGNWVWEYDSNKIQWSEELYRLFGLQPFIFEITPEWIWKHIHPEDVEKFSLFLDQRKILQDSADIYFRIIRPDKTERTLFSIVRIIAERDNLLTKFQIISQDVTERILQEKKYATLIESAPDSIITIDYEKKIIGWNKKAQEVMLWNEKEALNLKIGDVFSITNIDRDLDQVFNEKNQRLGKQIEVIANRKDATAFPAEITLSLIKLEKNKICVCFVRDLIVRKQVEKELKEKEELYRTVIDSLSEGLVIKDIENHILFSNVSLEYLTGYSKGEIFGQNFINLFSSNAWENQLVKNHINDAFSNETNSYELLIRKKNGENFWARINNAPYKNDKGDVVGNISAITDITISKREKELEDLVFAATKSYNSLIITDKNGKIEWLNEGFSRLFGYNYEEVIDKNISLLSNNHLKNSIKERKNPYKQVVSEKRPIVYETKKYSKAGQMYWVISTLTPVLDDNGTVIKIIAIDSDISRRKEIETQLKSAKRLAEHSLNRSKRAFEDIAKAKIQVENTIKAKEMFMANMSHEIRTPMNGIIGITDLLLKTSLSKEQNEYLSAIKSSGETLMVVINDVLDLSKIEAGKMTFEELPFKPKALSELVYDLFLPKAREKHIEYTKYMDIRIPDTLIGDPARLNQIMMNLISNAIKFTHSGKVDFMLNLKSEDVSNVELELIVKDTGMGIPEDKMDSIFLNYTQVTPEIARKYGGTGLGLAITKRLVEMQGGKINVKSKLGVGSEFIITLRYKKPLLDQIEIHEKSEIIERQIEKNLKGVRILLAEDNAINTMLAVKVLTDWDCEVVVAENGKEVINILEKDSDFDMILMDIKMPDMDGYQATSYIREKMPESVKVIPIIAQTAHAATWEAKRCLDLGMNDYISKPFDIDLLFEKVFRHSKKFKAKLLDIENGFVST